MTTETAETPTTALSERAERESQLLFRLQAETPLLAGLLNKWEDRTTARELGESLSNHDARPLAPLPADPLAPRPTDPYGNTFRRGGPISRFHHPREQ